MPRSKNPLTTFHKAARAIRKMNSAVYGGQVVASGNPKRMARWGTRKLAYKLFAKLINRV